MQFISMQVAIHSIFGEKDDTMLSNAQWSSGNTFVSEAKGLRFKSRTVQIGLNVANGSPPLRQFYQRSCIVRAQWRADGPENSLHTAA